MRSITVVRFSHSPQCSETTQASNEHRGPFQSRRLPGLQAILAGSVAAVAVRLRDRSEEQIEIVVVPIGALVRFASEEPDVNAG